MNCLISIITVHRNQCSNLQRTLESVQEQDYPKVEHIVIDGASTDGSLDLIRQYDSVLAYWVSEPDSGIYDAMNKGIRVARGEYLLFLNAGDVFYSPSALREAVQLFPDKPTDILYGKVWYETQKRRLEIQEYPAQPTLAYLAWKGFCHQAMFFKRELFDQSRYDESLRILADWKFYTLAIALHGASTYYLDFAFSVFAYGGFSSLPENRLILEKERNEVLQTYFPNHYPGLLRRRLLGQWLRQATGYGALQWLSRKVYYLGLRLLGK